MAMNYRQPSEVRMLKNLTSLILFMFCIICFLSVRAYAEENRWYLYYKSPDGTEHSYDPQNIIRTSKAVPQTRTVTKRGVRRTYKRYTNVSMVQVREKMVFNNPDYALKESRILREFNCSQKTVRTLMKSETYKNGLKKIEGKTYPWESVSSKPSYDFLYEILCH
jgi:hypothetical protein